MSDVMKKIILYAAVLFSAVSCKVEYGESGYLTSGQLQSYASDIVYVVVEDMRILNLLIDIDEYLSMTQEEQKDSPFYGLLMHEDGETLVMDLGAIDKTVFRTGGKSINGTGAVWTVENYPGGRSYYSSGVCASVECTGTDKWSMNTVADDQGIEMRFDIQKTGSTDTGRAFSMTFSGTETDGNYRSEFRNEDGACSYLYQGEQLTGTFAGSLIIDIYENGTRKDWCRVTCSEDWSIVMETSRD